ncbi:DUF5305 domain-containing protein [Natrononativus amylolyticus]|uniref:DUF5305 domain-containing protein n=1 Tax=Natrononativus amylolyticus TaxID=2963434 RepID=UPI0020CC9CED|nr:DUF5305 domain-containing protein [Natrononativus amylolyticus]
MTENPRVDLLIATHGRRLLLVLVVVGVLAVVAAGWVAATPETTTVPEEVGGEVSTEASTSALVVQDGLWAEGTELEDNAVYLLNDSPTLVVSPATAVGSDDADVTHEVRIRLEATRGGSVFWEETATVDRHTAPVEDGVATSEIDVDVPAVLERKHDVERELGGVGTVDASLEVLVEYDTGEYAGELAATSPLEATGDAYWLEDPLEDSNPHTETVHTEVTDGPNVSLVALLLVVGVSAFGAAAVVYGRSDVDPEQARQAVHKRRYAEWISNGTIPMWIGDHQVELDSLEDVVDVAIDSGERVVHDRRRGLFAVVNDDVVYYFSERGTWEETAWPSVEIAEQSPPEGDDAPDDLVDAEDSSAWEKL